MTDTKDAAMRLSVSASRHRPRTIRAATLGAGALAIILATTSCSSPEPSFDDSDIGAALSSIIEGMPDDMSDDFDNDWDDSDEGGSGDWDSSGDSDDGGDGSASNHTEAPDISFHLPDTSPAPDGWQITPVDCLDDQSFGAYVSYAFPGDWALTGKGGGSGGPDNMGFDYRFDTEHGKVKIEIASDAVDLDGNINQHGEIVEDGSFDYEISYYGDSADRTISVNFESLGTVDISGNPSELFVADPGQAPDDLRARDYRVRIKQFDTPQPLWDGSWGMINNSFVVTIIDDVSDGTVDPDMIKEIISTFAMPECSINEFVTVWEMTHDIDLDKDGYISTMDDYMKMLGLEN